MLCSYQARAVSLDDLDSPNPIVERTFGSTPDRSAGQAEQYAATIVTRTGEDAIRRLRSPARERLRLERDRLQAGAARKRCCTGERIERTKFCATIALLSARDGRQDRAALRMQFAPRLRDHDRGALQGQHGHDCGHDDVWPSGTGSEHTQRR